jgi:CubicO group peptidase (beta-lactamase class C family)
VLTLRQLVSHSAGLTVHGASGYRHDAELPTTVQILDGVRPTNTFGVRVDTIPSTQFRYSGGGTVVMQQLLEDFTGTPFRRLVRELVLEPLGMSDSDYAQPLPNVLHAQAATAHDDVGRPIEGRWHTYPEMAAAGLWTTPTDLCKFAVAVQRAYAGADGALLSPGLARELLTP